MKRPSSYNTRQSEAIIGYIASLGDGYATAAEIARHFEGEKAPIGVATIYRHLDRLVAMGKVRKYALGGASGACYQHIPDGASSGHFHLKCDNCGATLHLRCEMLDEIPKHVYEEHSFQIDRDKIVFYGKCTSCQADSPVE
ncbi:MAG: transcriptional repressor [Synergistaceae bacterium]|jgi:Fur family ferric uptake transcriptional regulator|nr:transcriptional repressor [Synergistaceae bacterium]